MAPLRRDALALLAELRFDHAELSIVLTTDEKIRELNRAYRGKDVATDVLSFPQSDGDAHDRRGGAAGAKRPPLLLGDIVISLETAERQAHAAAIGAAARLRTLLIHGLLHLLGYDHERSPAEARRQFARERALAARLTREGAGRRRFAAPPRPLPHHAAPAL